MECYTCKKTINRPPSLLTAEKNFCNHKCYSKFKSIKWQKGNNPRHNPDLKKEFLCVNCKKLVKNEKGGKYCSIKCSAKDRGILQQGENHWNWKGGKGTRYLKKIAPRPRPKLCEVCSMEGKGRNGIVLDHNHKTNKFRGWLCSNCNTTLGLVKENTKTLHALIKYLNQENSL